MQRCDDSAPLLNYESDDNEVYSGIIPADEATSIEDEIVVERRADAPSTPAIVNDEDDSAIPALVEDYDSDDDEPRRRLSHAAADTAPAAMTDDDPIHSEDVASGPISSRLRSRVKISDAQHRETVAARHPQLSGGALNISVKKALRDPNLSQAAEESIIKEMQQMLDKKVFAPIDSCQGPVLKTPIRSHMFLKRFRQLANRCNSFCICNSSYRCARKSTCYYSRYSCSLSQRRQL